MRPLSCLTRLAAAGQREGERSVPRVARSATAAVPNNVNAALAPDLIHWNRPGSPLDVETMLSPAAEESTAIKLML